MINRNEWRASWWNLLMTMILLLQFRVFVVTMQYCMLTAVMKCSRTNQHEVRPRFSSESCALAGDDEPDSLLILAEEELVAVDLQTPGWPLYQLPYINSIHASSIVSASHINNIPHSLWERINMAGRCQHNSFSPRVCSDCCCHWLLLTVSMLLVVFVNMSNCRKDVVSRVWWQSCDSVTWFSSEMCMAWYGMVYVNLYSAMVATISNVLRVWIIASRRKSIQPKFCSSIPEKGWEMSESSNRGGQSITVNLFSDVNDCFVLCDFCYILVTLYM